MFLRVGTSGWHYKDWRGRFYPAGMPSERYLDHYTHFFNTVELNGVFYRLPKPEAVKHWYRQTPRNFLFAYKASRFITHIKKLKDPKEPLKLMFKRADLLKEKLAAVLYQLPPTWTVDVQRLHSFLNMLPKGYRHVMEFRHPSWFTEEIYDLLEKHDVSLCQYDMKGIASPDILTSKLAYVRMHGSESKYAGNYSRRALSAWVKKIVGWQKAKHSVLVYFNNDVQGHAIQNAMDLKRMLQLSTP